MRFPFLAGLAIAMLYAIATPAADNDPAVTPKLRADVVAALVAKLHASYVFPDVADQVAKQLSAKVASGGYDGATTSRAFAKALSEDLATLGKDAHFRVRYQPGFVPEPSDDRAPTPDELAAMEKEALASGYGIARVERLPGNVGYIDLRGFGPAEFTGEAYTAAMSLLAGTDAMIVDLRRNGGGDPSAVAYFMSHFFANGDRRHLNDIYTRPTDVTEQYWTVPVKVHYTRPVYVLTSKHTFSGGEECAYDFQTQKRATLVGETTGGGANPGDMVPLAGDFVAFIPTGRAINPITKTNWEHVGVKPDVAMDATQAKQYAYAAILRAEMAAAPDAESRYALAKILDRVDKDDAD